MAKIERELLDAMQSIVDLRAEVESSRSVNIEAACLIVDLSVERDALKTRNTALENENTAHIILKKGMMALRPAGGIGPHLYLDSSEGEVADILESYEDDNDNET